MKEALLGKTLDELHQVVAELGMPRFAAGQIASWLYKKGVADIAGMTDIAAANREKLAEKYTAVPTPPSQILTSCDGTRKYRR